MENFEKSGGSEEERKSYSELSHERLIRNLERLVDQAREKGNEEKAKEIENKIEELEEEKASTEDGEGSEVDGSRYEELKQKAIEEGKLKPEKNESEKDEK